MIAGSWQDVAASYHPWAGVIDTVRPENRPAFVHYKNKFIDDIESKFRKMPRRFRYPVAKRYQSIFKRSGSRSALQMLNESVSKLPKNIYSITSSDAELVSYADQKAKRFGAIAAPLDTDLAYRVLSDHLEAIGLNPPEYGQQERTKEGAVKRVCDPIWIRAQLRKTQGRAIEQTARDFGLVHSRAGIYSSDEALYRRKGQKRRNRAMLEECIAVNELGDQYTLAELSALSVSNPVIRRGELMVRIRGFEEVATERGDMCEFITITCPSRFHAYHKKTGHRNRKFNASLTPRDAQKYLSTLWARIRACLDRMNIKLYGFRVAEPNHCGCPHWHLMMFIPEAEKEAVRQVFKKYALADCPGEVSKNSDVRIKFVTIDPAKGSASGYIAKYISKNIDGHALDADLYGKDINEAVERIDAWAACWGIRQFQQVGGPPVTVWREARRLSEGGLVGVIADLKKAVEKEGGSGWGDFIKLMGGPTVKRKDMPVKIAMAFSVDKETGEFCSDVLPLNKYGEIAAGRVFGLFASGVYYVSRVHNWEIEKNGNSKNSMHRVNGWFENGSVAARRFGWWKVSVFNQDAGRANGIRLAGCFKQVSERSGNTGLQSNQNQGQKFSREVDYSTSPAFAWERFKGRENSGPWTCVNNCTGGFNDGGDSGVKEPDRSGEKRGGIPKSGIC